MKLQINKSSRVQASALIVTLLSCLVLSILMGSYLSMVQTQSLSVARAQAWQRAIVVAEAGVEEAMSQLNCSATINNLAVNSWTLLSAGVYRKTTSLSNSYATVLIQTPPAIPGPYPVIVSTAFVPAPLGRGNVSRTVTVKTKPKSVNALPGALVVSSFIDFSGFGITTDSFDSTTNLYSTGGLYDPDKATDHGDVVSISTNANVLGVSNGKIKGTLRSGPGGVPSVGANGSVGDMDFVNGGKTGIEDGHFRDDVNYSFPDAVLPPQPYWLQPMPGNYKINGTMYGYVLNNSSPWQLGTLDNSVYVNGKDVVLYVTDSIALGSKSQIHIAPGSSLKIYMGGASASISGQGIINDTGFAKNFIYYGLPSNTSLDFGANVGFVGIIYAPQASFSLGGGGKNTYDFVGASITQSAKMNGHYNFHYDQSLPATTSASGYVASSWDEL